MWPVAGWGTLYNKCKYTTSVLAVTKTLRVIQKKDIPAHTVLSLTTFLQMVVMLHQCDATATARFLQLFVHVSSSSIMEELDVPQMRREVESLQYQLAINREKSSITVTELVKWIEGCVCEDPFLNPELMRANPWVEKGKCVIL
uniref:G protein gamma domain-containing protein n=24 Tax=Percomorphaceae TaxID=1489872 RepID=A0AAQ4S1H2_GASAC